MYTALPTSFHVTFVMFPRFRFLFFNVFCYNSMHFFLGKVYDVVRNT